METDKFEKFLQDEHAKEYRGTDDDMYDNYLYWLENLDVQDLLDYGEAAIKYYLTKKDD